MTHPPKTTPPATLDELSQIKLYVPAHLYRAFHRCVWIQVHETGKNQLEIMEEMIEEYLKNHDC